MKSRSVLVKLEMKTPSFVIPWAYSTVEYRTAVLLTRMKGFRSKKKRWLV